MRSKDEILKNVPRISSPLLEVLEVLIDIRDELLEYLINLEVKHD